MCVCMCVWGYNLLSEKCGYGLPTDAGYAPFYAGLLFPFYGSNEIAYRFKSTLVKIEFFKRAGLGISGRPAWELRITAGTDSRVGVRKAARQ